VHAKTEYGGSMSTQYTDHVIERTRSPVVGLLHRKHMKQQLIFMKALRQLGDGRFQIAYFGIYITKLCVKNTDLRSHTPPVHRFV